jgi:hypothetical protein
MWWNMLRAAIAAAIIVGVSELSRRHPRIGALLLSLPIVSILAFGMAWLRHHDLPSISRMAKETLILVPLGLPIFVPLAFSRSGGLGFWSALALGILLAAAAIGVYYWCSIPSAQ